jgi:hypothetical protein
MRSVVRVGGGDCGSSGSGSYMLWLVAAAVDSGGGCRKRRREKVRGENRTSK